MSLSTRLILLLTAAVGLVMVLAGFYLLRQRQEILARAWRNELNAHAVTLQLALEDIISTAVPATGRSTGCRPSASAASSPCCRTAPDSA